MKNIRTASGVLIWLAVLSASACGVLHLFQKPLALTVADDVWQLASGTQRPAELRLAEPIVMADGDPIFVEQVGGRFRQIGEIRTRQVTPGSPGTSQALFYSSAPPIGYGDELVFYQTPDSLAWVLQTMLPVEKRAAIASEIRSAFNEHHEELVAALRPLVERTLRDALVVVEQDLPAAFQRRRGDFERIGQRYQRDLIDDELVPLLREEIWPVVRRHAEPAANEIGEELWQRVPLWRFGWRYAYDKSPLPEKQLVAREWERFVHDDVVPVLENRTDQFVEIQQAILSEVAHNERVQQTVRRSLAYAANDTELRQVIWQVFRDVIVDNPRLRDVFEEHWKSDEAIAAYQLAGERLEPTVNRIGEMLFGNPTDGITPQFAQVLRNQVLAKDKRWFVLRSGASRHAPSNRDPQTLFVTVGGYPTHNPLLLPDMQTP